MDPQAENSGHTVFILKMAIFVSVIDDFRFVSLNKNMSCRV